MPYNNMVKKLLETLTKHYLNYYANRQVAKASSRMARCLDPQEFEWTHQFVPKDSAQVRKP